MEIVFEPNRVALTLLWSVVFLTLVNIFVIFFVFYADDPEVFGLARWFDFDVEMNVPTFYSSFAILFCALLFSVIAVCTRGSGETGFYYWVGLAIVFLFLSMDELFGFHELVSDEIKLRVTTSGFLYWPWVTFYGLGVCIFTLTYSKFLFGLPKKTIRLFVASGVIYVGAAIGFDMLGGREAFLHNTETLTYCVLYTCEELFEMLGIVLLIYALLSYIVQKMGYPTITFQIKARK